MKIEREGVKSAERDEKRERFTAGVTTLLLVLLLPERFRFFSLFRRARVEGTALGQGDEVKISK